MLRYLAFVAVLSVASAITTTFNVRNPMEDATNNMDERQVVLVKDPVIFGLDMLGWGVDLRAGTPGEGTIKVPMYDWAFTEGHHYLYPLEPETSFQVPDEVFVRTVAEMKGLNRIYTKTEDYLTDLHLDIGLSIKASASKNSQSGGSSTPGSGNSTSLDKQDLSAFSGSVGVIYNKRQLSGSAHIIVQNSLESGLWQLVVGPEIQLRKRIQQRLAAIAESSENQYLLKSEFIDRYGTHFIDSVIVGGNLKLESITQNTHNAKLEELAIMANFGFKNMFGLDEGNLGLNLTFVDSFKAFEQDTTNNINVLGGDPQLSNFFRGDAKPSETFVNWAKTLIRNPAVIRTRTREMSWLAGSYDDWHPVITDYLAGRTAF